MQFMEFFNSKCYDLDKISKIIIVICPFSLICSLSVLRHALDYRIRNHETHKQMVERLYKNEHDKPIETQTPIILQCLDLLRVNLRLTAFELRSFLITPSNNNNSEIMVYDGFWFYRDDNMSLLERLVEERRKSKDSNSETDSDAEDHPFEVLTSSKEIRRRNRFAKKVQPNENEATTSRQRSRSRSPIHGLNIMGLHNRKRENDELKDQVRREIWKEVQEEVRRELEPKIREEMDKPIRAYYEGRMRAKVEKYKNDVDKNVAAYKENLEPRIIREENERRDDEMYEELKKLVDTNFKADKENDRAVNLCLVCLRSAMTRKPVSFGCGHIVCINCFWNCMTVKEKCPYCRQDVFYREVKILHPNLSKDNNVCIYLCFLLLFCINVFRFSPFSSFFFFCLFSSFSCFYLHRMNSAMKNKN